MTDTKTAVRQAAIGVDFGTDTAAFDPSQAVGEDVAQDKRGILLTDYQSYERIIEGLKRAADGCRHRAAVNHRGAAESRTCSPTRSTMRARSRSGSPASTGWRTAIVAIEST